MRRRRARERAFAPGERATVLSDYVTRVMAFLGASQDENDLAYALGMAGLHWTSNMWHDVAKEVRQRWAEGNAPGLAVHSPLAPMGGIDPAGHPCRYCGASATAIDHVWPRARGGDDHPYNLVPTCQPCNSRKASRSILGMTCPTCGHVRHPADVETSTGEAFYHCRCGASWTHVWNLQRVPLAA